MSKMCLLLFPDQMFFELFKICYEMKWSDINSKFHHEFLSEM